MRIKIALLIALAACLPVSAEGPVYKFEAQPRAALSQSGINKSRDPKLALRASGALYMLGVHGEHGQSQLGLFVSHDGGDSFAPPIAVSEKEAHVSSHGENSPSLAFGSTYIYALWEQSLAEGGTDLMFARSINFGRSFEKPLRVTDKAKPSTNAFSHMAVAPNGHIYAAWLDGRDPTSATAGTSSVYLAKSSDRGASFGKNIRVWGGVCPCCRPVVSFGSNGEIFIAWRQVFEGDVRDMVVATSVDGGETFSPPARVAVDNWKIAGCPHSGPALAQKNNRLYVAWFSEGDGTNAGVRVSWSDDRGKTFARPVIVPGKLVDTNHPVLSVSEDGRVLLVFKGRDLVSRDGWGPMQPYIAEISDAGTVSQPVLVAATSKSISYPTILAATLGRIFVAWTEPGEKGTNIVLSRGRKN